MFVKTDSQQVNRLNKYHTVDYWKDQYQKNLSFSQWPIPKDLAESPEVIYRNHQAESFNKIYEAPEIVRNTAYYTFDEMQLIYDLIVKHILREPLKGNGIEIGSGCGILSCTIAKHKEVDCILSVELCHKISELLAPKVAKYALKDDYKKVIPISGNFNNLCVKDGSLNFACEIGSYHHSYDLKESFQEIARALKPNSLLLCLDRVHPNELSDKEVEEMLAIKYGKDFLEAHQYPDDLELTRRDNGEHEYRFWEWAEAYQAAGFRLKKMVKFYPRDLFKHLIQLFFSVLPKVFRFFFPVQRIKNRFYYTQESVWTYLRLVLSDVVPFSFRNKYFEYIPAKVRKEVTVFLLEKC